MHQMFQRFLENLQASDEAGAIKGALAEAARAFDLPNFAYLCMPRDQRLPATVISTHPVAWTQRYLKHHYERLDPVIRRVHACAEPFEWGIEIGLSDLTNRQKDLFDEAATFGIRCGYTVPIKDRYGAVAAMTFASDLGRPEFQRSIAANGRVLQMIAMLLHLRLRMSPHRSMPGVELKPRERDCLAWAAAGKTAWEIGQIMGITERAARYHLDAVRLKFGVSTIRQAVAIFAGAQTR